jgi:hypothetical protein
MREIADLIHQAIVHREDADEVARLRARAVSLATRFPLPGVHLTPNLEPRVEVTP